MLTMMAHRDLDLKPGSHDCKANITTLICDRSAREQLSLKSNHIS